MSRLLSALSAVIWLQPDLWAVHILSKFLKREHVKDLDVRQTKCHCGSRVGGLKGKSLHAEMHHRIKSIQIKIIFVHSQSLKERKLDEHLIPGLIHL